MIIMMTITVNAEGDSSVTNEENTTEVSTTQVEKEKSKKEYITEPLVYENKGYRVIATLNEENELEKGASLKFESSSMEEDCLKELSLKEVQFQE